jgi:hypothetical protein
VCSHSVATSAVSRKGGSLTVSRDFRGRRRREAEPDRLPPGQYVTDDFPVLSAGPTPQTPLDKWTFSIVVGDDRKTWTWEEFQALPSETVTKDIHCVTRWSKFDTTWEGVPVDTLLEAAKADAPFVVAFCDGGYTTNLPVEDITEAKRGLPSPTTANHSNPSTAGLRACLSRTSIFGRAQNGCAASPYARTTSPEQAALKVDLNGDGHAARKFFNASDPVVG